MVLRLTERQLNLATVERVVHFLEGRTCETPPGSGIVSCS
jgi:hypothetical protein